ncbi:MAG: hypothetical protein MJ106_06240 [Lentisphaeria bacterium]|nr:hypothetical protein [Lentisphaeria bacterium]
MKRLIANLLFLSFCAIFLAKSASGENILKNGELFTDRVDTPPSSWEMVGTDANKYFEFCTKGGPEDMCYVRLVNGTGNGDVSVSLRYWHLSLVAGERYKLSCWIRSVDLKSRSAGFDRLPPTQDWTYMETEFTAPSSPTGEYFIAGFGSRFTGELDFADIRLEALTEKGRKESGTMNAEQLVGRFLLVPWEPLLQKIPSDAPVVNFKLFGNAESIENLELRVSVSDVEETVAAPLTKGLNSVRLPKGANSGELTASVVNHNTGEVLYCTRYPYSVIDIPKIDAGSHRRLNNLCTEILSEEVEAKVAAQHFSFVTPRDGWIFIAAEVAASAGLEIVLDGDECVIDAGTPRLEAFREVAIGRHDLEIKGAVKGGRIIVRSIAETLNYPPCANSKVAENPPYDWNFLLKYSLPCTTTQNGGDIPVEKVGWLKKHGYHWLGNLESRLLKDDSDLIQRFNNSPGMHGDYLDGVTCDEQFFRVPTMLLRYTRALHNYDNLKNHKIYSWIVGEPESPGIDEFFISETMNSCGARGKLMAEIYTPSVGSEEEAADVIRKNIVDTALLYKDVFPNIYNAFGIVLGNFNQVPIISLHHHPEVDLKYFLDMQFNLLANAPELDGLGLVGYWGSYYADHEFHRWSFMLMRHYVIEGNTTMLSDKYGLKYIPGHIVNGDFSGTFAGWEVKGNVSLDKFEGLAKSTENRWNVSGGVGDTFAVFTKEGEEVSTLKQTAKGLVPGKAYLMQFCTFDVDRLKSKNSDWGDFGIRARLGEGATIRNDLSWQHIDKRGVIGSNATNNGVARPNLHHVVFIADASEVEITIDNALAKPGEHLGVNFFTVLPFVLEEK